MLHSARRSYTRRAEHNVYDRQSSRGHSTASWSARMRPTNPPMRCWPASVPDALGCSARHTEAAACAKAEGGIVSDQSERIVKKLWSYCQVLRDDGLSYQDYLEQLTFLLFLKMADERAALTGEPQAIPKGFRWVDLANPKMEGVKLEQHYRDTLKKLGEQGGMLGLIFRKAQNKIQDPAKLRKLVVDLIGNESWLEMSADVKGDAYEGLLERNAQDTKSGAGQYFTPRPLIERIVDCVQPEARRDHR